MESKTIKTDLCTDNFYSHKYRDLIATLKQNPSMRECVIDLDHPMTPPFLRDYPYKVGAWPCILSDTVVFDTLVKDLPPLCYKVLKLKFGNDLKAFSKYFDLPEVIYQVIQSYPIDFSELLIRYDTILSGGKCKVIEINSGSAIGGWQYDWVKQLFSNVLKRFEPTRNLNIRQDDISRAMVQHLIDCTVRLKGDNTSGAILWYAVEQYEKMDDFEFQFKALFDELKPQGFTGSIEFIHDVEDIEFTKSGQVIFQGKVIDCVLISTSYYGYTGTEDIEAFIIPEESLFRLGSSHLAKKVANVDSPMYTLLGSKRLLALLHEYSDSPLLTHDERAIIEHYIPATYRFTDETITWKGQIYRKDYFVVSHKDELILKKSASSSGRDVIVGSQSSVQQWRSAIQFVEDQEDWLIQECCQADPVEYCSREGKIQHYDFVWGIFGTGTDYSGSFIRADVTNSNDGIVNSATGALVIPVFMDLDYSR